jgi:hypothetical protein
MEKGIVERECLSGCKGEIPDHKTGYYTDSKNGHNESYPVHLNISVWMSVLSNKALFRYGDPVDCRTTFFWL